MNLLRLRRRSEPAATTPEHHHMWRLGALALDYPNARTAARSAELDATAPESTGAPR
ncbi:hypothetical protein GPX89_28250 [Nocardia sp. ET3-3]|uniref:Uncharacterized protein n=1 Tax=Nocardia terrae TaxID=2675851 RepID=A0A7K1V3D0_9NOCA|nr:hypothetical protein [Nocardia terrae]MVU81126.1 hypothetical protein [Nocardia terrae]